MKFLRLIVIFCFFLPGSDAARAGNLPKILLINSDASVDKYKEVEEAFREAVPNPIAEINLGEAKWDSRSIENLLYDEYPELTYCIGTRAYHTAIKYAGAKSIVFSSILNWLRLPMTSKTYGVSNELHAEMQLALFRYIFPDIRKIGMLYSKKYTEEWFKNAGDEARKMGIEIIGQAVSKENPAFSALEKVLPQADVFWLISDPDVMSDKKELSGILKECDAQKKPVLSYHESLADMGAVLVLSVDNPTVGRQAARIAAKVISGAKPDETVQNPAGSHIILNLKKVKAYGLKYNEDALESVNSIIQ